MYQAAVADRPQAAVPALAFSNQAFAAAQGAANATHRPRGRSWEIEGAARQLMRGRCDALCLARAGVDAAGTHSQCSGHKAGLNAAQRTHCAGPGTNRKGFLTQQLANFLRAL